MEEHKLNYKSINQEDSTIIKNERDIAYRLNTFQWSLFFSWIVISLEGELEIKFILFGIGMIIIFIQIIRRFFSLKIEVLWFIVALVFISGGFAEIYNIDIPILTLVLILAGIVLLIPIINSKHLRR